MVCEVVRLSGLSRLGGSFLPTRHESIIVIKHFILMQKNQPHNLYCNFKLVLIRVDLCFDLLPWCSCKRNFNMISF